MVGVRQRLAQRDSDNVAPSGIPPPRRSGVRQRLEAADAVSSAGASSSGLSAIAGGRRGGTKRRLEAQDDAAEVKAGDKPFNRLLREKWARGTFSAAEVLELAETAARQGCRELGPLDTSDSRNAHRKVMAHLGTPAMAPEIEWIEVPMADGTLKAHPIVCPIALVETMQRNDPARFIETIRGPEGDLEDFWEGIRGHDVYKKGKAHIDKHRSIPVGLHGDGAPTTKVDGLFTISWNSIIGKGSTELTRQVFTVVRKSDLGDGTLDCLWRRLSWAFNALIDGVLPASDWAGVRLRDSGRVLAEGLRLAPVHLRGDWEFFSQACNLPTAQSVPNCCWMCQASPHPGRLCWTDGSRTAGWRGTLRSHEAYIQELHDKGEELPGLFAIKTLRLEGVMADVLHSMDLGLTGHVAGNIMVEAMASGRWAGTKAERLQALQHHLDAYYKEVKEQYKIDGKLTQPRVHKAGDWPKFKGKAASTRKLARYSLRLAQEFNTGSIHDRLRLGVAQSVSRIYDIFAAEPRFLSPAAKAELADLSIVMMGMYGRLAVEALGQEKRAWKMTAKFHLVQHICEHQSWINPRESWCYADEDLQRLLKGVAKSCHPLNTPFMVLHKWLCIVFED